MDKKSKLILALLLIIIALLAFGVYYLSYKVATIENSIQNIADVQKLAPKIINGKDGVDGKNGSDGVAGLDGRNGVDGIDSKSTYIEKTFYTPIPGPQGEPGKDAPVQEIRINPDTKNLESKSSSDRYWYTLVPCSQLLKSCPTDTITEIAGDK